MDNQIRAFIRSVFPSVWALELLILLAERPDRAIPRDELVALLRASDSVVINCGSALVTAGLAVAEDENGLRYAPASDALAALADKARELYRSRPDAVRRLIVARSSGGLDAFADAFRLRKDEE